MSTASLPYQRRPGLLAFKPKEKKAEPAPEHPTVKRAEHLFRLAKEYRDDELKMERRWRSYRSWYLSTGRERGALSSNTTYVNHIYEKCEKLAADVTEAMPDFMFNPLAPSEVALCEYLSRAMPASWEENGGDRLYREAVKSAILYGTHLWKIAHDPGYGPRKSVAKIYPVPCYRFFPAPYATCIEDAPFVIEVCPRTVEEIENDYGVRVEPELEPNSQFPDISEDLDDPRGRYGVFGTNLGGASATSMFPSNYMMPGGRENTSGIVWQKELWIRDSSMESKYWIELAKDGPELKHGKDLKHPGGRCISWANGRLLYDTDNPYQDRRFPYVRFSDNPFPEFFWGLGEVPNLINLQLLHDDMIDTIRLTHAYMANGRLIVDKTTGLKDRELGNDPGEVWWTDRNTQDRIKWLPGLAPPAEFYTHLSSIERWVDLVTGSFDVTRGVNPSGVTAARALVALQRAAGIRVRGRMREMEDTLIQAATMIGSRIQQFAPSQMDVPDGNGSFEQIVLGEDERLSPFNVKVEIVSNLDDLRSLEFQKLLLLFNLGAVGKERLIKDSGLSSAEVLLAELPEVERERMLQQAAMDVAQAAQQVSGTQKAVGKSLRGQIE